jgi:hypothetical protein
MTEITVTTETVAITDVKHIAKLAWNYLLGSWRAALPCTDSVTPSGHIRILRVYRAY